MKPPFKVISTYTKESLEYYIFKDPLSKDNLKNILNCFLLNYNSFKDIDELETIFFTYDYSMIIINNIIQFINKKDTKNILNENVVACMRNQPSFTKCIQLLNYFLNYFDYTLIRYHKLIETRGIRSVYKVVSIKTIIKEYPFKRLNFDGCYYKKINNLVNLVVVKEKVYFNTSRKQKVIIDLNC